MAVTVVLTCLVSIFYGNLFGPKELVAYADRPNFIALYGQYLSATSKVFVTHHGTSHPPTFTLRARQRVQPVLDLVWYNRGLGMRRAGCIGPGSQEPERERERERERNSI